MSEALLALEGVSRVFKVGAGFLGSRRRLLRAVDRVDLAVRRGEVLGLVGESGCGKSTLGRLALGLLRPSSGRVFFQGREISGLSPRRLRPLRRQMQIVFQDPVTSLNPRLSVGSILAEPFVIHGLARGREAWRRAEELLEQVGLRAEHARRYPHQFSGGQRQRIGIARALALRPQLVVADEPVSALDVSIQAQVLNLLADLRERFGLTYLFVAHDLSVVRHLSDRIAVMYLGRIVEVAPAREFVEPPMHPYTEALLAAAPLPDPRRKNPGAPLQGDPPSPLDPPPGCRFHPRCREAREICRRQEPSLRAIGPDHLVACHLR